MIPPDHSVDAQPASEDIANALQILGEPGKDWETVYYGGRQIADVKRLLVSARSKLASEKSCRTALAILRGAGQCCENASVGKPCDSSCVAYVALFPEVGAVSPTAPPAEQDTPHPSLPAPEDRPQ